MTTDPYLNTHIGLETETVVIFVALAIIAMGIDMWAHRSDNPIALKQAVAWTLFWISIGLGFAGFLYFHFNGEVASLYLAGYLFEQALSVDNLFVMMAIFAWFKVPEKYCHRVLYWGVLGAVVFRMVFVVIGSTLFAMGPVVEIIFALMVAASGFMMLTNALLPIGLAFFLRALLLDYQSADYQMFLSQWAAAFRDGGGFAAVKLPIGNYNAPYLYFLAAISYLPIPDLYLIKLFSILFDVVLAWGGFRLVRHFAPERPNRPLLCFCLLLLLPTVILNGAFWGQCDALYGALTLHALACALEGRNRSSLLLLGIAFSFKLQTVFVLPLWGGLWLLRRVRFRELLWFPAAYAATCVPALLLGKPLGDILGVYFGQAAEYSGYLNLNAPNMYALIPHGAEVNTALAARLGILAAFALAAAVLAALLVFRRQADDRALLAAAVVLAIGVPFLLPHMHERYFFLADVLALAWTCAFPRSAPCALLVELASLGAYVVVLRGKFTLAVSLDGRLFPMLCEALLMLAGLAFAVLSLARRLAFPQKSRE